MTRDITALAESFPTLRGASGVSPWDPDKFEAWACGPAPGSGALAAARFVLAVYAIGAEWKCGRFDVVHAMNVWDEDHREAFVAWACDPWVR